ncbi:class IV adenylate cyclase [Paeniglutamicibacter psychrophenolicus]|uniref:Adenylate cyclase n=1 Tax=Paeniglutamicibacter psychrophenolicus TaxID=257454 RepID=A0ABS4WC48_9MICC|nr:class IV adenylate cyclase [Paeniglutamicibacter psychrophenolicus]MBP2373713.1 adenylate cyclase [Paeniglutamicibacter psychrophenolicus]
MPTNIEIKARVDDLQALFLRVAALADSGPTRVDQDDTFFSCPNGRLKLRVLTDGSGVLIFYRRDDALGPKPSFYVHSKTSDPDGLRAVLATSFGEVGRVRKQRVVFHAAQAKIHLDTVDGLGEFLELEIAVDGILTPEAAQAEAHRLLRALGIEDNALVKGAYLDLLETERVQRGR